MELYKCGHAHVDMLYNCGVLHTDIDLCRCGLRHVNMELYKSGHRHFYVTCSKYAAINTRDTCIQELYQCGQHLWTWSTVYAVIKLHRHGALQIECDRHVWTWNCGNVGTDTCGHGMLALIHVDMEEHCWHLIASSLCV